MACDSDHDRPVVGVVLLQQVGGEAAIKKPRLFRAVEQAAGNVAEEIELFGLQRRFVECLGNTVCKDVTLRSRSSDRVNVYMGRASYHSDETSMLLTPPTGLRGYLFFKSLVTSKYGYGKRIFHLTVTL